MIPQEKEIDKGENPVFHYIMAMGEKQIEREREGQGWS